MAVRFRPGTSCSRIANDGLLWYLIFVFKNVAIFKKTKKIIKATFSTDSPCMHSSNSSPNSSGLTSVYCWNTCESLFLSCKLYLILSHISFGDSTYFAAYCKWDKDCLVLDSTQPPWFVFVLRPYGVHQIIFIKHFLIWKFLISEDSDVCKFQIV